jgi:hypothetical protein
LALLTFNIAYDTGIFLRERHRIQLSGCYLILPCTGARPTKVVDNEKKRRNDGCLEELFGPKAIGASSSDDDEEGEVLDGNSRLLEGLRSQETVARGHPKALCYEGTPIVVCDAAPEGRCRKSRDNEMSPCTARDSHFCYSGLHGNASLLARYLLAVLFGDARQQ